MTLADLHRRAARAMALFHAPAPTPDCAVKGCVRAVGMRLLLLDREGLEERQLCLEHGRVVVSTARSNGTAVARPECVEP